MKKKNKDAKEEVIRRSTGKQMTKETKVQLYNNTSEGALECDSESWIVKQRIRQRLGSAPMKFL
jgi:hypothetical protein